MLGLAYAGTGDPEVIERLLRQMASDADNDVKRFAVIAIGFVMIG